MKRRHLKSILILILLFGAAGYFREFFFVHVNRIMYGKYYVRDAYEHESMPLVMRPFNALSYSALYYLKYPMTILWVFIFYLLNRFAIGRLSEGKFLFIILNYSYLMLLAGAAISMAVGYFINGRLQDDEYTLSRWLMGIAQSPIICLILLASNRLLKKKTDD
jgi:hypothetical protein